jgi:lysine biosynthesis protein LysW
LIVKCPDCGNTFKIEKCSGNDVVACPVCEADYKLVVVDGKPKLQEFVYESEDLGEL